MSERINLNADVIKVKLENGRRKFQIGDGKIFEVDIADAWDHWCELLAAIKVQSEQTGQRMTFPYEQFIMDVSGLPIEEVNKANKAEKSQFINLLNDCMKELKKNTAEQRGLPVSTDSTPSASTAGSSPSTKETSPASEPGNGSTTPTSAAGLTPNKPSSSP